MHARSEFLARFVTAWRRSVELGSALVFAGVGRVVRALQRVASVVLDAALGTSRQRDRPASPETRLALVLVLVAVAFHTVRAVARGGGPVVLSPIEAEPLRVDVNVAPVGELLLVPGVGPVIAERIRRLRRKRRFHTLQDLQTVHGIGPVLAERMQEHVLLDDP